MAYYILVLLTALYFYLNHLFNKNLSKKFPEVWKELDEPGLFNISMKNAYMKLKYIKSKEYQSLGDPHLTKIGNYLRIVDYALFIFWGGVAVWIMIRVFDLG